MTNKEKRKKMKQDKKEKLKFQNNSNNEISGLVKILLSVVAIFSVFYLGVGIYNGEIKLWPKKVLEKETEIQYSNILIGETFNRPDFEYYVVMYDFKTDGSLYNNLITSFLKKNEDAVVYRVDLSNGFNKNYVVSENPNRLPNNASELKVLNPTLIKVQNKKSIEYIDTKEAINTYLTK